MIYYREKNETISSISNDSTDDTNYFVRLVRYYKLYNLNYFSNKTLFTYHWLP